jgi:hypothetical protein
VGLAHSADDDASEQHVSAHVLPVHRPDRHCDPLEQPEPPMALAAGIARPIHAGFTQY